MSTLVLGATGSQGGAVATALLEQGAAVRALVRDPASARARALAARGVDLVAGDLTDVPSLTAAMTGAEAAFAVTTPFEEGPAAEIAQGRAVVAAAAAARLPHLVLSSVASATAGTGVPHFETKAVIEADLAASGLPATVVAPAYFMENALGGLQDVLDGRLLLPLPADRPLQQLARADFGRLVARVLADPPGFRGQRIEVASDAPTPQAMAAAFSAALGRPVLAQEVPFDEDAPGDMPAMWRFLRHRGYAVDLPALHRRFDIGWTGFDRWARSTVERLRRTGG
ncbi:NmrA family NAD(P)-binding protein [Kineococcus sp. SYSU DK001]|uniref:NmrA family NAD(P)-binding protein n=1 Tax=Kineococcus sp. SYSU DK001 TaxID=3383122 RepID=UPI003D7F11D9